MEDAKNQDIKNATPAVAPESGPGADDDGATQAKLAARRKFIAGGLAAAPVLATLSNRSALATYTKDKGKGKGDGDNKKGYCQPSIYASLIQTTSLSHKKHVCDGRSPGYWWSECKKKPVCNEHLDYYQYEGQKTWGQVFGIPSPHWPEWYTLCMVLSLTGGRRATNVAPTPTMVGTGGTDDLGSFQVAHHNNPPPPEPDRCEQSGSNYWWQSNNTNYGPCCEKNDESASLVPGVNNTLVNSVYGTGDLPNSDPQQFGAHAVAAWLNATVLGASNYMDKATVKTLVVAALTNNTAFGWDGWSTEEVVDFFQQTFS
ncbi:MAG: hypothetical protein H6907_07135 [Hyphomicrobiales bacterium]|nr:hypothetical protein [Hyphomicrobiales bacterium]